MKKINIGLDIGIASVGWAVVDFDSKKILKAGSRLFDEANSANSKTQTASNRREQRGRRRNLRRKITRKHDLIELFVKFNYLSKNEDFYNLNFNFDLLENRKKALNELITLEQLMLILFNYIKHRGTFNYREDLKEIKKVSEEEIEIPKEVKLPIEMQLDTWQKTGQLRGINSAESLMSHEWYVKEIELILNCQIKNDLISEDFKNEYLALFNRKRAYYDGPGPKNKLITNPSPYGWKDQKEFFDRLAGKDTYDSNEQRSPKHTLTAYIFNILNDLNNLKINDTRDFLTEQNKIDLVNLTLLNKKPKAENLTLKKIAANLGVDEKAITGYRLMPDNKTPNFTVFESINKIRSILQKHEKSIDFIKLENIDKIDEIVGVLTKFQSSEDRTEELIKLNYDFLDDEACEYLGFLSLTGTHSLSKKTINKLLEIMWPENLNHMEALKEKKIKPDYKLKIDTTNLKTIPILRKKISEMYISPVVKRALIESLKIIKELESYFKDYEINDIIIEMAREKNSEDQKAFINKTNAQNNEVTKKITESYNLNKDTLNFKTKEKFSLLSEQDGKCAYSGKPIDIERLKTDTFYCEVDHIIPLSISFDNAKTNKVLVLREENQEKGKLTPYQYFRKIGRDFDKFRLNVMDCYLNNKKLGKYGYKKYLNLTNMADFASIKEQMEFVSRNLNDTRYATVEVKNYLEFFKNELGKKWKIKTINGKFTSFLRSKVLELPKKDRDDYSHHAKDAVVIALSQLMKINQKETIGDLLDAVEKKEFHLEENEIQEINESGDENFKIKRDIESFDYVFSKKKVMKNNNSLFNETLYVGKEIDGALRKILKVDIFDETKTALLNNLFTTNEHDLFIKESDPKTFEYLKEIFYTYFEKEYTDEKGKIIKIKNPFSHFRDIEKHSIHKQTKEENPPLIKNLRYLDSDKNVRYHEITHKFKSVKNDKRLFHTSFEKIGWHVYFNEKIHEYKVIELNIKTLNFNSQFNWSDKKYHETLKQRGINEDFTFKFNLSKYDELEFEYDGLKVNYIVVGSVNDGDRLEFKNINKKNEKRIKWTVKKIKNLKKITSNITKTKIKVLD